MKSNTKKIFEYRPDIDGLRGLQILCLIAFHSFPNFAPGGYVGVSIFFVISGYLITNILLRNDELTIVELSQFWCRRIKRIFPALITTLLMSLIIGYFFLLPTEYEQLAKYVIGGALFFDNFVALSESGYFDNSSIEKPLLNLWSLAIEEQFYIIWPFIILIIIKLKNQLSIIGLICIMLFSINIYLSPNYPAQNFYFSISRFFEIASGGYLAIIARSDSKLISHKIIKKYGCGIGIVLILYSVFEFSKYTLYPGYAVLIPVLGSILVIASEQNAPLKQILNNKVIIYVGLISYPLYLIHWSLNSFLHILNNDPSKIYILIIIFLSFFISLIIYRYIENPIRLMKDNFIIYILIISLAILSTISIYIISAKGLPERSSLTEYKKVLSQLGWRASERVDNACIKLYPNNEYCKLNRLEKGNRALLIGDSIAGSYYHGLSEKLSENGISLTLIGKGGCPPLLNIKSHYEGSEDFCNNALHKELIKFAELNDYNTIILSANWHLYALGNRFSKVIEVNKKWVIESGGISKSNQETYKDSLVKTIEFLISKNKLIIFLDQPPELNNDLLKCQPLRPLSIERLNNCNSFKSEQVKYLDEYKHITRNILKEYPSVMIIDPLDGLCPKLDCLSMFNGYPLYRDYIHLSEKGSELIAQYIESKYKLSKKINNF